MSDVFNKALGSLKLNDFAGELPTAPKLQEPSSLDIMREAGVVGQTGTSRRQSSIDIVGQLIKMENQKKQLAKLQGIDAAKAAIPSWTTAMAGIQGFDAMPYESKKAAYDDYVQRAVKGMQVADPKTDPALLEQQIRDQAPAPVDPTGGKGDFSRGLASYVRNTKAAATGALGFALNRFGQEDVGKSLMATALAYTKEAQDVGKVNDAFTEAIKPDGSLIDYVQFMAGQTIGSVLESAATATIGAAIGGASSGGVLALPAGIGGFFGKSLLKKEVFDAVKKEMLKDATEQIAKGATREAALTFAKTQAEKKLAQAASRVAGSVGGLLAASGARGVGEIVQNAQQAGIDPSTLSNFNVATGAGIYALAETFSDKLLLDTFLHGVKGGALKRTLLKGGGIATTEGTTEVVQDVATGIASGAGAPNATSLVNSFAGGFVGGGVIGGGAALARPSGDTTVAPSTTGQTNEPNVDAPVDPNTPVDVPNVPVGTVQEFAGANVVRQADQTWAYQDGATPNPQADMLIQQSQEIAAQQQPGEPGTTVPLNQQPTADPAPLESQLADLLPQVEAGNAEAIASAQQLMGTATNEELQAADALAPQGAVAQLAERFGMGDRLFDPYANTTGDFNADGDLVVGAANPNAAPSAPAPAPANTADHPFGIGERVLSMQNQITRPNGWERGVRDTGWATDPLRPQMEALYNQGLLGAGAHEEATWLSTYRRLLAEQAGTTAPAPAPNAEPAIRVQRGERVLNGTAVESAPRTSQLTPATLNDLRSLSPNEPIGTRRTIEWYFQPGTIVQGSNGENDVVTDYQNGADYGWQVTVQSVDAQGRINGRPRIHSTPPTARTVLAAATNPAALAARDANVSDQNAAIRTAVNERTPTDVRNGQPGEARLVQLMEEAQSENSLTAFEALSDASSILSSMTLAEWRAAEGTNTTGFAYFVNHLGLNITMERAGPGSLWVEAANRRNASSVEVLTAIADSATAGNLNSTLARNLRTAFNAAGVPFPSTLMLPTPAMDRMGRVIAAEYVASTHEIQFTQLVTPVTVLHENMHALTARGVQTIMRSAAGGNQRAADTLALITDLHMQLVAAAGNRITEGNRNTQEMFAELMRPEFVALAARTPLGTLSVAGQRAAGRMSSFNSILTALRSLVTNVLSFINEKGGQSIDPNSVLELLTKVAAEAANLTSASLLSAPPYTANSTQSSQRTAAANVAAAAAAPADTSIDAQSRESAPQALINYASQRGSSLTRGVQRGRFIGVLVDANASMIERVAHFKEALTEAMGVYGFVVTFSGNQFNVAIPGRSRYSTNGTTISVSGGINTASNQISTITSALEDATGFGTADSNGGKYYDAYNGAVVSARFLAHNSGSSLSNVNQYRMPGNRLRGILKWGSLTGDFNNAAKSLSMVHNSSETAMQLYERLLRKVKSFVEAKYPGIKLNASGNGVLYTPRGAPETEVSISELRAAAQANTSPTNADKAASPDAALLVALYNTISSRRNPDTRGRVVSRALNNPEFARLFSYGEAAEPAAETTETDNSVRPERRTSTSTLSQNMRNGVPATPATAGRGLVQAAQARDSAGVARALRSFGEKMNEELHDATVKMKRWLQSLPELEGGVSPLLKQRVIGAMYTARKLRNEMLRRANDAYLRKIDKGIAAFAKKHNISIETAQRDIGYMTTATYVPIANANLIQQRVEEVAELQRLVDEAKSKQEAAVDPNGVVPEAQSAMDAAPTVETSLEDLQAQLSVAQRELLALVNAIHSTNLTVARHGGGGVAGMNNAQAADMLAGLLQRHGAAGMAEIQAIAEKVYDLNAWKLALDIETGKTTPAIASRFLRKPEIMQVLQELRDMANAANAEDKAGVLALEAKRKQVMALVRSKYVPLSGDPTKDIDDSSFHGGSGIPNVQQDYRLQGRERGAPPDDGISTSRAALMKSASYAGWRDFQDGIAAVHRSLNAENRTAFGLRAETIVPGRSTLSNKAVVRYRNGKATAYIFNDESLVDSIRGANRLENNFLLEGMGKVTKFYAYMATQANPFFAPFNFIRDSWERNELMRTRTYLDADGRKVNSGSLSNTMLKYLASPELLQATARHAFGKSVNNNSRIGRYLEEFLRQGGVSTFSSQFSADRAKMVAQINKQKGWRQQLATLAHYVEGYNKTLDLGPALAAFVSMRDAGMTPKDAAAGSLDLMDFGKRGKSANVLGAVYAFSQPTFTGAANALGALRDPVSGKWNKVGVTRLAGYAIGLTMLQAFLRSLADDDEGGNKLDQQSPFMKNNFLLIPFGDDGFIKVPLAYGLTRVANGIARAALGVSTDEQTPGEALGKLASGSVVPVFSPIEDSDIDWSERPVQAFLTLLSPSWMKPAVALATNVTPFDTGIVNEKYGDPTKFKSEQYGKYIPEDYKAIAQFMRKTVGIDMAPEEVRYLVRSYPTGIAQLALNGIVEKPEEGFTGAAQQKVYAGYSEYSRYFQFKKAIDETDDLLKRTKAGETISDDMERKKLLWRLQWDEQDKELRSAKGKATRAAQKLGLTKDAAKDSIDGQFGDTRMAAQVRALYRYRLMQGKDATVGAPPDLTK